jgi:hypothetical protein
MSGNKTLVSTLAREVVVQQNRFKTTHRTYTFIEQPAHIRKRVSSNWGIKADACACVLCVCVCVEERAYVWKGLDGEPLRGVLIRFTLFTIVAGQLLGPRKTVEAICCGRKW